MDDPDGYLIGIGNPIEGCSPLINSEEVRDNVVLLERGDCMFTEKARAAEEAGAKMVIILQINTCIYRDAIS